MFLTRKLGSGLMRPRRRDDDDDEASCLLYNVVMLSQIVEVSAPTETYDGVDELELTDRKRQAVAADRSRRQRGITIANSCDRIIAK